MIDLLKNYNELQTASDYKKSIRYCFSKKKIDTLFLKWLSSNKETVEELLSKAQSGKLKAAQEPNPLFSHHRVPLQNSQHLGGSTIIPNSIAPPQGQNFNESGTFRRTYNERDINKSLTLSNVIPRTLDFAASTTEIPQFYFPNGKPLDPITSQVTKSALNAIFGDNNAVPAEMSHKLIEITGLPTYFSAMLTLRCTNNIEAATITKAEWNKVWKELETKDLHRRAFWLLSSEPNKKWVTIQDFKKLFKQILSVHPGLSFLHEEPQFQTWYSLCVIHRMYYMANRKHDYRLTYRQFRQSSILKSLMDIEGEPDINANADFFSYEDFYVIYMKFWEIDNDHDFFLTQEDLSKYSGYTLSRLTIQRIFSQSVRRFLEPEKMGFGDFVWFILAIEDKTTLQSIEYWFKIIDLDANGIVTGYELEAFYEQQSQRLAYMDATIDFNFQNIVCQMMDLFKPARSIQFTLEDFLKSRLDCGTFINMLTDLNKLIAFEQKDPFEERTAKELHPNYTDWDRFAKFEYRRMNQVTDGQEGGELLNWQHENQDD